MYGSHDKCFMLIVIQGDHVINLVWPPCIEQLILPFPASAICAQS